MIRTCSQCGRQNRVPAARLTDSARCGGCKAPLAAIAQPVDVDAEAFDEIVAHSKLPILVDFWAAWCGPCRMAAPELKKVAAELSGRALVLKVDTDQQPALAQRFHLQGIPHFVIFRGGRPVFQQSGLVPAQQLKQWLLTAA